MALNHSRISKVIKLAYESAEAERLEELEESDMTDEEIRAKDAIVNGDSSVEYSA